MEVNVPVEELRESKIMVCTPMYGGMCSGMYSKACADLATLSTKYQMDLKFFYLFNESLIPRARNYLSFKVHSKKVTNKWSQNIKLSFLKI